jgi:glycosyltransferase involved in cell wall biosynthesis
VNRPDPPRLLLLGMYPLDRGRWGATTRIAEMRDALSNLAQLDVISGTRGDRARALLGYLRAGRLGGLRGIYVENATTLPGPVDLAFLALARRRGIAVATYVRDAQQLFPEYFHADTPKRRASRALFLPATRALMRCSSVVAFPSRGLAAAVLGSDAAAASAVLLPPGSRPRDVPALDPAARTILFVGGMKVPAHGGDILLGGVELARSRGHDVELVCVSRPGEELAGPTPDWYRLERGEGDTIEALLPGVLATITPRRRTPYNDLAVPIKVMEYLGYARPMIVTDATEQAAIVREAGSGVVVPDTAEGIAHGIAAVRSAAPGQLRTWAAAALAASVANSWAVRAARVLELLGIEPTAGSSEAAPA